MGAAAFEVRTPDDLERADSIVLPGGESTTMLKLMDRFDLRDPLSKRILDGLPALATCAGAIVLATEVSDGEPPLRVLDISVTRNAYGRQRESFESDLDVVGLGSMRAVFIRAPVIEKAGPGVEVLATWMDRPVVVRQARILASTFHPELAGDEKLHRFFVETVAA